MAFDIGKGCLFEIAQSIGNDSITNFHIAFRVDSKEKVQTFYNSGINAGAKDNGKPGPRPDYTKTTMLVLTSIIKLV